MRQRNSPGSACTDCLISPPSAQTCRTRTTRTRRSTRPARAAGARTSHPICAHSSPLFSLDSLTRNPCASLLWQPCVQQPPWSDPQIRPRPLPPLLPRVRRRHRLRQVSLKRSLSGAFTAHASRRGQCWLCEARRREWGELSGGLRALRLAEHLRGPRSCVLVGTAFAGLPPVSPQKVARTCAVRVRLLCMHVLGTSCCARAARCVVRRGGTRARDPVGHERFFSPI